MDKVLNGDDSRWWKGYRFNYPVYETLLREAEKITTMNTDISLVCSDCGTALADYRNENPQFSSLMSQ